MSEQKRHPQHPGGVWPLNVEYRNEPRITVMAAHPDDAADLQAQAEAKVKAQAARDQMAEKAVQDAEADAPGVFKGSKGKP